MRRAAGIELSAALAHELEGEQIPKFATDEYSCRRVPGVEDVRVLGGIGVVETKQPVNTAALQNCFVEQGVWIRPFNRLIYLMPPYVSPIEDVARLCAAVETALRRGVHCA